MGVLKIINKIIRNNYYKLTSCSENLDNRFNCMRKSLTSLKVELSPLSEQSLLEQLAIV